ncbi:N-acetyl-gamma-glutamyl-phosphate reductase [Pedobacter psychrotolerans]|uniref:N-acetyl-gamma-glutamyl-phosphate reductase n=1 Tax=Pedobacter psychrotolerans TaxID=1843235 RepID=A0A4R2HIT4_9SPHI|nr:N-acetyl-gamma-glutamyl-phosphate reductase [Pedobacter psychrotolerans]TCO29223.1 N-acetyl-gamma-glutamyl-phosphate reductase [Pedobacter psychrotolerans]GGE55123.1 N-acetyl-gamma-glutamyl-phosphate reductase [Pedobacter psychrotolerans]
MSNKIKAGIIGGAGYTGGEMLRILINHPDVEIAFVNSTSNAGNLISDVHTDLIGDTDLKFVSDIPQDIDVLFLCVGHGDAQKFLIANPINDNIKIIDLSQDFRLKANSLPSGDGKAFIYGLPELNREAIKSAKNIANPGCFATCIQLGLLPLAAKGLIKSEVHINATTGSTGAGQGLNATSHFSWRNNNLSIYKAFEHQHLNEIGESLLQATKASSSGGGLEGALNFIPQRGAFTRGILASMYLESDLTLEEAQTIYEEYYSNHPFTYVSRKNIDLKQVVNTNKALVHVEKHGNKLFIISIIDNLLKGASGQAVQNMNLMFGLEETAGLKLKAAYF